MRKIEKKVIKGFITGVAFSIVLFFSITPSYGSSLLKDIQVYMGGIQIYVDGNLRKPVDANGNNVEPMIYKGTTYLPIRALTNILTDKSVEWDGNTTTVYIGKRPDAGSESKLLETLTPLNISWASINTGKSAEFKLLDETIKPFNRLYYKWGSTATSVNYTPTSYAVYNLKSEYSSINGEFVIPYTNLGSTNNGSIDFYSVDKFGEKTLIDTFDAKAAEDAKKISVPLRGVEILRIEFTGENNGIFYNVTLTTLGK